MLPPPTYVISDLHLGQTDRRVERDALAFLRHVRDVAGSLVINGDLFEFWFEWRTVIPRSSYRVLAALADLREAGIPVLMTAGNHDCWGDRLLREDVGLEYTLDPWTGSLGGWRAHIEHGDGLRPEDRTYRAVRRVLRNQLSISAFRLLHPDFGMRLAGGTSRVSRARGARDGGTGLRIAAEARLKGDPGLELVVYGHSHVPTVERAGGGVYANAGSWLQDPTYLLVDPERISLRRWLGSADGPDLDTLDRMPQEPLA